jgi:manganese/iron transport system permease protein
MLEPFAYQYMINAMWVSALVGALCAALSAFLMLKGWSLIGDALSHAIVPGVAGAYMLGLPLALGAFASGGAAALAMLFLNARSVLKEDTVIGIVFTAFFGAGLFMVSISPTPVDVRGIIFGNILAISPSDTAQLVLVAGAALAVLAVIWRDLLVIFFDETHGRSIGLRPMLLKGVFFALLAASCVAALQTVGAFLVVALLITPGATAYLLSDRFGHILLISVAFGAASCFLGAYFSYFLNGATGGVIICMQTLLFLAAFVWAPRHGILAARRQARGQ